MYLERLLLAGCSESDLLAGGDLSAFLAGGRGAGGAEAEDSDEEDMAAYLRSDKQMAVYHEVELLEKLGAPTAGDAA